MDWLIDLAGCVGAWLLVAGPLLQASNELRKFGLIAHERDRRLPSVWWWLLWPVMYVLSQRELRDSAPETRELRRAATGWYLVATGGWLIALKETWRLGEAMGWDDPARIAVFAGVTCLVWLSTSIRMIAQTFQDRASEGR